MLPVLEGENCDEGQTTFSTPTSQQQSAINDLKDCNEDKIYAWLAFVRSLEPGFHYRNSAGGLSHEQVNAVSVLKECNDSDIAVWLQYVVLPGKPRLLLFEQLYKANENLQTMSIFAAALVVRRPDPLQVLHHDIPGGHQQDTQSDPQSAH